MIAMGTSVRSGTALLFVLCASSVSHAGSLTLPLACRHYTSSQPLRRATPIMDMTLFHSKLTADIQQTTRGLYPLIFDPDLCDTDGMLESLTVWTYSASDLFIEEIQQRVKNLTIIFGTEKPMTKKQLALMLATGSELIFFLYASRGSLQKSREPVTDTNSFYL